MVRQIWELRQGFQGEPKRQNQQVDPFSLQELTSYYLNSLGGRPYY